MIRRGIVLFAVCAASLANAQVGFRLDTLTAQDRGRWDIAVQIPVFRGTSPLAKEANAVLRRDLKAEFDGYVKEAQAARKGKPRQRLPWFLDIDAAVATDHDAVKSTWFEIFRQDGDAPGRRSLMVRNFAVVGGKAKSATLAELLGHETIPAPMAKRMLDLVNEERELNGSAPLPNLTPMQQNSVVVTREGLTWILDQRAAGSYRDRVFKLSVSKADLKPWIASGSPLSKLF